MYKSRLQEICHKKKWELPIYASVKKGPSHLPRFTATVNVHGQAFETPEDFRSGKEAENAAARIAYHHFNDPSPVAAPVTLAENAAARVAYRHFSDSSPVAAPATLEENAAARIAYHHFDDPSPVAAPVTLAENAAARIAYHHINDTSPVATSATLAENAAARIAYHHFNDPSPAAAPATQFLTGTSLPEMPLSPLPSSLPIPPPGLLRRKNDANTEEPKKIDCNREDLKKIDANREELKRNDADREDQKKNEANREELQENYADTQTSAPKEGLYKNLLQEFAQKRGLLCPSYETISSGMSHMPIFVSVVAIEIDTFRGDEAKTKKQAEMNAAKAAYLALTKGLLSEKNDASTKPANQEELQESNADTQTSAHYEGLYKNLLQEFAQKKGLLVPTYETVSSGMSHRPVFVSVVAIGTETFKGDEAKTKKQAEMKAAKVAYFALTKEQDPPTKRAEASPERHESQPLQRRKTIVIPRKLIWSIPEHANVKPYSNEQWVAFDVLLDKGTTA